MRWKGGRQSLAGQVNRLPIFTPQYHSLEFEPLAEERSLIEERLHLSVVEEQEGEVPSRLCQRRAA